MPQTLSHDPDLRLFIADVDGVQATVAYASVDEHTLDFQSTYVPHALRNRNLGTQLVRHALAWARDQHLKVVPSCWFVAMVMDREPEWRDLRAVG